MDNRFNSQYFGATVCPLCHYEHNIVQCPYYQQPIANGYSSQVDVHYNQFQAPMQDGFYPPTSASPATPSLAYFPFRTGDLASPLSSSSTGPSPSIQARSPWAEVDDPYDYDSVDPTGSYESQTRNFNMDPSSFPVNRSQVGSVAITAATRKLRKKKEPAFFCTVVGCNSAGFTEKHNLLYHMRSHRNIRPYECTRCGKRFMSQSDLTRHIKAAKKPCEDRRIR